MLMRFSYSVTGPVKFLSHLDLLKYFCKALKRAEIPIAYSEGFNPHPKIAFGPPRGVGIAGLNEYCDLKLKAPLTAAEFTERFNRALPKGIKVNSARAVQGRLKPLQAVINRAEYEAEICGCDLTDFGERTANLLAADNIEYVRHNPKKGDKIINLRRGIESLCWQPQGECGRLTMVLIFGEGGSVKPAEVIDYLTEGGGKAVLTRNSLFVRDESGVAEQP